MNLKEELTSLRKRRDRFMSNYGGNFVSSGYDALKEHYIGKKLDEFLYDSCMGCNDFELMSGEKKFRLKDLCDMFLYTMKFDETETILSFTREKINIDM